ncbi:MAG: FAD-binding oxidoreductase [Chloroflexales bacterium]|nr:FAD-binding oxidoreductase [Chloroflexales bacterium]
MSDSADVVVIGGGSSGTSIAWQLAQRGAGRVVLLEALHLAAGASGRSSAIIRTHYTHPALARMAQYGLGVFERFNEVVDPESEVEFRRTGFLVLVGPQDAEALGATVALHQQLGIDSQVLSPGDLAVLEPRLALDEVGAAAWEPRSGYADPHGTVVGFARAARRAGATLRLGASATTITVGPSGVTGVETSTGRIATGTVVVAAGYRTRTLLAPHGVELPLTPVRHTITLVRRTPDFGPIHPVLADFTAGAYARPEGPELTLIGTAGPLAGREDPEVEQERPPDGVEQAAQRDWFLRRFPDQAGASFQGGYTGTYDVSPDAQPLLGPVGAIPGLHVAAGLSGHGFKLSPAIGALIAEQILTGRTSLVDLALFDPGRFAARRPIVPPFSYTVPTPG